MNDTLKTLASELCSVKFQSFLSEIYGKKVFIDPSFLGGGIHQGGSGSFLDMHTDFSRHTINKSWVRELNVLLYLNEGYQDEWGGHLELKNGLDGRTGRIAPIENRLVVMLTKEHTIHGYKKIKFPDGRYRTSLASYAYSIEVEGDEITPDRSTVWQPENAVKRVVAQIFTPLVLMKGKIFGSGTAKRSKR